MLTSFRDDAGNNML